MSEIKTILSFGGGVDTTAILHMPDVMKTVDEVIFADTGGEQMEYWVDKINEEEAAVIAYSSDGDDEAIAGGDQSE